LLKQEIPVSSRVADAALKIFKDVDISEAVERGERIGWMDGSAWGNEVGL